MDHKDTRKKFAKNMGASAIGKYTSLLLKLLLNILLSRILSPSDFGIAVIAQVFIIFFDLFTEMGIGPAIVQKKNLSEEDLQVIYKFTYAIGFVIALITLATGYPASLFYASDVYKKVFILLSADVFIQTLYIVPFNILRKEQSFMRISKYMILGSLTKFSVTMVIALLGGSFYAIIVGGLAEDIVLFLLYTRSFPIKWGVKFKSGAIKKISSFARNQFVFNLINYFSRHADTFLIGKFFGVARLGYYDKAYSLSRYPGSLITGVLSPILHPVLADKEKRPEDIMRAYLKIISNLAFLALPISVFFIFNARDIILFLFGDRWLPSVPILEILAFSIWYQLISSASGSIFQAADRTDLLLLTGIQSGSFNLLAIIAGIFLGSSSYVALTLVVTFFINFVFSHYLIFYRVFNSNFKPLLIVLAKPMSIALALTLVFSVMPNFDYHPFVNLLINGGVTLFLLALAAAAFYLLEKTSAGRRKQ